MEHAGEHPDIRISLVIVTYNRADELLRLLHSLEEAFARPEVELVLVDDGSTDDTAERVAPILRSLGGRAQYLRQDKAGPGMGRNRGIMRARGEILVFIDTDCVAPSGWLDALCTPFDDPTVGAAGGPDRSSPDDPLLTRLIDYLMTAFLTTGGVRGRRRTRGGVYYPRSFNMAVRKRAAVAVGGFPLIWYGEDVLLSWRIAQAGWGLRFVPEAWVYHRRRTSLAGWMRQLFRMGRARGWMARYDRRLLEPIYLTPLVEWVVGLFALVGVCIGGLWRMLGAAVFACAAAFFIALGLDGWRHVRHPLAPVTIPPMFILREGAYTLGSLAGLCSPIPDLEGALARASDAKPEGLP